MKAIAWFDPYKDRVLSNRQLETAVAEGETAFDHLVALCYQKDLVFAYQTIQDMTKKSAEMQQISENLICHVESLREEVKTLQLIVGHG
jgi:hypothetical protein